MSERESEYLRLPLLFIFLGLLHFCSGEIGTAGHYAAPYLRKHQRSITVIQSFQTDTFFSFLFLIWELIQQLPATATMCLSSHQATYSRRPEMGYGTMGQRAAGSTLSGA